MLRDKFIQEDPLRNRKRPGPLAWVGVFIAILFLMGCAVGAYTLLTRNVSRLRPAPAASPTPNVESATLIANSNPATPTIGTSSSITWTVWATQNPNGETVFDGPPEIKTWVLRDYQEAQRWKMSHLFGRDYLLNHLGEYFTGKALDKEKRDIEDSFDGSLKVISAPLLYQSRLPSPMDKPVFNAFSQDGTQMSLSDFNSTDWKFYDTRTHKQINAKVHKGTWGYTLEFDPSSKRWKIARLTLKYDLDDDKLTYVDQIFRTIQK